MGILFVVRHLLDAEAFASFAFYLALAIACYGFCKFSFDAYAVREFVLHPANALPVLRKIIAIRVIGSGVVIGIVILGLRVFDKYEALYSIVIIFQIVRAVDSVEWLLRAEEKLIAQALVRLASMLFVISALIALVVYKPVVSGWHIVAVQVSEWCVILIVYSVIFALKRSGGSRDEKIDQEEVRASVRKIVSGSVYVYIGFVLFLLYSKVDQFLLNWLVGPDLYGIYMIAARLTESAVILIMSFNMFYYPKLVCAHQASFEVFSAMIRRISLVFLLMAVLVVFCVWGLRSSYLLFPLMIRNVVPYELLEILSWMIFSVIPVFFFGLRSSFFTIVDRPKNILIGSTCGVVAALFVGVPLMQVWGVYGGIACVVLVAFSSLLLSNFFSEYGRCYLKIVFGLKLHRNV